MRLRYDLSMALDTRDYWKKKWNKRTGYKENADFRIGVAQHKRKRYRLAWRQNFNKVGLLLALIFVMGHVLKALLTR